MVKMRGAIGVAAPEDIGLIGQRHRLAWKERRHLRHALLLAELKHPRDQGEVNRAVQHAADGERGCVVALGEKIHEGRMGAHELAGLLEENCSLRSEPHGVRSRSSRRTP